MYTHTHTLTLVSETLSSKNSLTNQAVLQFVVQIILSISVNLKLQRGGSTVSSRRFGSLVAARLQNMNKNILIYACHILYIVYEHTVFMCSMLICVVLTFLHSTVFYCRHHPSGI